MGRGPSAGIRLIGKNRAFGSVFFDVESPFFSAAFPILYLV